jgi:hypothetical protein
MQKESNAYKLKLFYGIFDENSDGFEKILH